MIPDRQIVYLLQYLRDKLISDKWLPKYLNDQRVVNSTLMRPISPAQVYKGEVQFAVQASGLPCLALWRGGGKWTDKFAGNPQNNAQCQFAWICRVPGNYRPYDDIPIDGIAWASSMATMVWDRCSRYLWELPVETRTKAGISDLTISDYDILYFTPESIVGFTSSLTIEHQKPPYEIDDMGDLYQALLDIHLYDSSGPTDLGLIVEADHDATA